MEDLERQRQPPDEAWAEEAYAPLVRDLREALGADLADPAFRAELREQLLARIERRRQPAWPPPLVAWGAVAAVLLVLLAGRWHVQFTLPSLGGVPAAAPALATAAPTSLTAPELTLASSPGVSWLVAVPPPGTRLAEGPAWFVGAVNTTATASAGPRFVLAGPLPRVTPRAPGWRLAPETVNARKVSQLAVRLGVTGAPHGESEMPRRTPMFYRVGELGSSRSLMVDGLAGTWELDRAMVRTDRPRAPGAPSGEVATAAAATFLRDLAPLAVDLEHPVLPAVADASADARPVRFRCQIDEVPLVDAAGEPLFATVVVGGGGRVRSVDFGCPTLRAEQARPVIPPAQALAALRRGAAELLLPRGEEGGPDPEQLVIATVDLVFQLRGERATPVYLFRGEMLGRGGRLVPFRAALPAWQDTGNRF